MLKTSFDAHTKTNLKEVAKSKPVFRCPKHPRYNPTYGGGAIVGACSSCREALDGYEAMCSLRHALSRYITKVAKFETARPRSKKPVGSSPALDSAFKFLLK